MEPLGIGPNGRKMYSLQQFEELWIQRAQNRALVSKEPKSLSTGQTSGKMGRVLARMQSERVA